MPCISSSASLCSRIPRDIYDNHSDIKGCILKGFSRESTLSGYSGISRVLIGVRSPKISCIFSPYNTLICSWRLKAIGVDSRTNAAILDGNPNAVATLEIPVTCYQLIGVPDCSEKDEIVKSVMNLKSAEIEEGYTLDAVVSRQDLLMDVRDKLLFEPEYAGNMRENIPPKYSLRIPWAWLPGALCLFQEVGEVELVVGIGQEAVRHPDLKPYIHDILLSMALAECATAKISFEKNKVSQGFEALAHAQCLLRSKTSLERLTLLSQIEESLEDLAPACTLELLGMPRSLDNSERRQGAIAALCVLLRQGLDVQTSCRVQDWPCFLSQALKRLTAKEVIDLLPWSDLAAVRKNKKSLESQNQRIVIDSNCFSLVLIAHIALGFSSKQTEFITKAKAICESLTASEGVDLKLEEAFCSFLLGQGTEADVIGHLQQLELDSNFSVKNSLWGKETVDGYRANQSLETWLKDAVLGAFPDTKDFPPSMDNFFNGEKKTPVLNKRSKGSSETLLRVGQSPMSAIVSDMLDFNESLSQVNPSQRLGTFIKQLTLTDSQNPFISDKDSKASQSGASSSVQLKRNLVMHRNNAWEGWLSLGNHLVSKNAFIIVLGCIGFATSKLFSIKLTRMSASGRNPLKENAIRSSLGWKIDASKDYMKEGRIAGRINKFFMTLMKQQPTASWSDHARRVMSVEEAEALVKHWQAIKAEALGPTHEVHSLPGILDETMLIQWETLADTAKAKSCYWKFVLLQLTVQQPEILLDEIGSEMAEIEALLEEAAELVNESEKNQSYYNTYKVHYVLKRQDDGSWRFCEGNVLLPS